MIKSRSELNNLIKRYEKELEETNESDKKTISRLNKTLSKLKRDLDSIDMENN